MSVFKAGLIGANIGKSRLSRALDLLCQDAGWTLDFTPIDTAGRDGFDFNATVDQCRAEGWLGVTVTHPYKTHAAARADRMVGAPDRLGAANTLLFRDGEIIARNTDYTGFLGAWRAGFGDRTPGRVAMAGAGGVSRAIAVALVELGATNLVIWDVLRNRADAVAETAGGPARAIDLANAGEAIASADGLVNATPLGMTPYPGMAFRADAIGPQKWAFDAVYTPIETEFLATARGRGLVCLTGFDLFTHMALRSFDAYTGLSSDAKDALAKLRPLAVGL